ncbi:helix-turn-helix domain-containing protein [Duganella sp. FT50W]|uniref:Helix-turn-helix domain-containing protein n=2 Tax=Duganella lactea TaxID=2692173 RepID=A0A6L8MT64_9BURK|nr:helix-turn-helix domain-containing protein [Duganella lactea]
MEKKLLTPKALAELLGLAEQTIYNRHSTGGDLPQAIKLGRRLRFHPADVDSWLECQRKPAVPPVLSPHSAPSARRPGRPTNEEQIAVRLSL